MLPPIYNRKPTYYPQPLALVTSGCEHLPCLRLPLFSGTVYPGNFYIVQSTRAVSFMVEPVSKTNKNHAKTKYKGLSYWNPIVPFLISRP